MKGRHAAGYRLVSWAIITLSALAVLAGCGQGTVSEDTPTPTQEAMRQDTPTPDAAPTMSATVPPSPNTAPTSTATVPTSTPNDFTVADGDISLSDNGGAFIKMLDLVPDNSDTREVAWIQDFNVWWSGLERAGVERPGADSGDDLVTYLSEDPEILGDYWKARPWVEMPYLCCDTTYLLSYQPYPYISFDLRSADHTLLIDLNRIHYEAALGSYDPDFTASRLEACEECIEPEVVEYERVTYYSWGEDFQGGIRRRLYPPLFDHAGRGGRVAVGDGYALRTLQTKRMEDMIDTMQGDLPSLADSDDYELAARAMIGMNAYAADFVSEGMSLEDFREDCQCDTNEFSIEERVSAATSAPLLEPFTVAAAGYAFDEPEGSAHTVLALVHEDESSAQTNADRIVERLRVEFPEIENIFPTREWRDPLVRVEIAVDGKVLLMRLYREPAPSGGTHINAASVLLPGGVLMHE